MAQRQRTHFIRHILRAVIAVVVEKVRREKALDFSG